MKYKDNFMQVRLMDRKSGVILYDKVKSIRLKSHKFDVMIYQNHMPYVGEIDGQIIITTTNNIITLEVNGFFYHKDNVLLILKKEETYNAINY